MRNPRIPKKKETAMSVSDPRFDNKMPWRVIPMGGIDVALLPQDIPLSDGQLMTGISDQTSGKLGKITAPMRRLELLRSRWLLRQLGGWSRDPEQHGEGDMLWPPGFVGSITHKTGHVACALGKREHWRAVGIDLEGTHRAGVKLAPTILCDDEKQWLSGTEDVDSARISLVFSVKEALFKAVFPVGRKMFWFHDARIIAWTQSGNGQRLTVEIIGDAGTNVRRGLQLEAEVESIDMCGASHWLAFVGLPFA